MDVQWSGGRSWSSVNQAFCKSVSQFSSSILLKAPARESPFNVL